MGDDEDRSRAACTECQRRKQKCDRQWPCNHCQRRKVAPLCYFKDSVLPMGVSPQEEERQRRRREIELSANPWDDSDDEEEEEDDDDDSMEEPGPIEAIGYSARHYYSTIGTRKQRNPKQYTKDPKSYPALQRSLETLPPRPYTDLIVTNFLDNANFHYYILSPDSFLKEYQSWWEDRDAGSPLSVQWTGLLLITCASSLQYSPPLLRSKLSSELGQPWQKLSEKFYEAAVDINRSIPIGENHLIHILQNLLMCFWLRSEARFLESWHALNSAVREAQALGIHQESVFSDLNHFDRESYRRVWCLLDTWDWQMSPLLDKPLIIDRSDCQVQLPSLDSEACNPSPCLHLKLLSQLIRQIAARFGDTRKVAKSNDAQEYQSMVETWMDASPPIYDFHNPDTSQDQIHTWIVFHRHYLRTATYTMLLNPIRHFLATRIIPETPRELLQIRQSGVSYALSLMQALHSFYSHVWPHDAKFHLVLFRIFDTTAVLASIIIHDLEGTVERREDILVAITNAFNMMKRLQGTTEIAKRYTCELSKIIQRVNSQLGVDQSNSRKRLKASKPSPPLTQPVPVSFQPANQIPNQPPPMVPSSDSYSDNMVNYAAPVSAPLSMATGIPGNAVGPSPYLIPSHSQAPFVPQMAATSSPLLYPPHDSFTMANSMAPTAAPFMVSQDPFDANMLQTPPPAHPGQHPFYSGPPLPTILSVYPVTQLGVPFTSAPPGDMGELGNLWKYQCLDLGIYSQGLQPVPGSHYPA